MTDCIIIAPAWGRAAIRVVRAGSSADRCPSEMADITQHFHLQASQRAPRRDAAPVSHLHTDTTVLLGQWHWGGRGTRLQAGQTAMVLQPGRDRRWRASIAFWMGFFPCRGCLFYCGGRGKMLPAECQDRVNRAWTACMIGSYPAALATLGTLYPTLRVPCSSLHQCIPLSEHPRPALHRWR